MKFYVPKPQSLLLYASILFLVCLTIGAFTLSGEIGSKEIGVSLLSVFGTFLGAFLAFRLNENKEYAAREKEKKQALNRALFILARQVNAIQNIQKSISPYAKDDMRAFNLPAIYLPNYSDLVQKIDELDFLLAESDPNILLELDNEQKCFDQMIKAYTARTDFMFHEVQPAISQNQLNGQQIKNSQLKEKIGERLFEGATNMVNNIFFHVEESTKSLPAMHTKLLKIAESLYPDKKDRFIKIITNSLKPVEKQ